jgi:hypothetical protein
MKFTPENIEKLHHGEVFVFGSNESGYHGAGAAKKALEFGAKMGLGFGPSGKTFAIPTKDWDIQTLPLGDVAFYVKRFVAYAKMKQKTTFLVTKIGCGLAGFKVDDIAGIFRQADAQNVPNIILPEEFVEYCRDWDRRANIP